MEESYGAGQWNDLNTDLPRLFITSHGFKSVDLESAIREGESMIHFMSGQGSTVWR